jgi:predicted RNA-binding Zn ribbon-like protein
MTHEVWETRAGTLVGSYPSLAEALRHLREAVRTHGREYLATFALVWEDGDRQVRTLASGDALADLAERAEPSELSLGPQGKTAG